VSPVWNWKTALASGCYRAPAFIIVSVRAGWAGAARASLAEFLLFATIAGFTGAAVQRVRNLRPEWTAWLIIFGVLPLVMHTSEYLLHTALGSAAWRRGMMVSLALTVLSESFAWHGMRQGAWLAGAGGRPLLEDLARLPFLVAGYLRWVFGRG